MSRVNKLNVLRVGIILAVLSCVSACGQKGDLYLPPEVNNSFTDLSVIT